MQSLLAFTIPGLEWLSEGFAYALKYLYDFTGNFGLAIILITVGMRLVLLPLTIKQTKSMIAMQRLQPQLKEIQKKYKDDREKQGQEMMKLYKENKVSPLGGCLPLILQLPIIFAIFDVLHSLSAEATNTSAIMKIIGTDTNFMFLTMDMTMTGSKLWAAGDYAQVIVLVLLTVSTGYVSAKMMTTDPKQAKMMAMMPVLMGVFAWILPAGVTIYIILTNILTFMQQYIQLEREGFYDEKRAGLEKSFDDLKWYKKLNLMSLEMGSKMMIAVKLSAKPSEKKKKATETKPSGKKSKKAGSGKATKATKAKKGSEGKKLAASQKKGQPGKKPKGKKATGGKTAGKKSTGKAYPAKRKSKGTKK